MHLKMKRITLLYSIATALILGSCRPDNAGDRASQSEPVLVETATAGGTAATAYLSVSGTVTAAKQADLSTRTMGYVRSVQVRVGDRVAAGTVLLQLDNADLQARMAQTTASITEAEAAYAIADKDYQRYTRLFADQSASQKELDDITARYQMAGARLEAARQMKQEVQAQVAYTRITAPFAGVVTHIHADAGDLASPGQPLIAIEAPGDFEVEARIPEHEISGVAKGDTALVYIKALGKRLQGYVSELSNSARQSGGQYLATLTLTDQAKGLRSGMYATLDFAREGTREPEGQPVLIPETAIVRQGQLTGVYTVSQSNTGLLRWVRLGRTFQGQTEVLSGLKAGEAYIVSAKSKLYNGVPVRTR